MSKVMVMLYQARFAFLTRLSRSWILYAALVRMVSPAQRSLLVARDTELVLEGFPRSANTFAVVAFECAQEKPVRLAHHIHAPCQITRAAKLGIPVCVLVREPEAAVLSALVMSSALTPNLLLRKYIDFYMAVAELRDKIVIATFEEAIGDFGKVTERINRKFHRDFGCFVHTQQNVELVKKRVAEINRHMRSGEYSTLAAPHEKKEDIKKNYGLMVRDDALFAQATAVYRVVAGES